MKKNAYISQMFGVPSHVTQQMQAQQRRQEAVEGAGQIGALGGAAIGALGGAAAGAIAHSLREREDTRNWFQRLLRRPVEQESMMPSVATGAMMGGALGAAGGAGIGRYVGAQRHDQRVEDALQQRLQSMQAARVQAMQATRGYPGMAYEQRGGMPPQRALLLMQQNRQKQASIGAGATAGCYLTKLKKHF